jgi:phenylalanyl-tRNA synthetase beta subunit
MKISYNWLQNYFEEKLPEPGEISEGIIFHSFEVDEIEKIKDDTVFDIKILPDRAHDCLSHWGIAKEVSMIFDMNISSPNGFLNMTRDVKYQKTVGGNTSLKIQIEDEKCLRYMGRVVRNIKVGESPLWLKEKLNAIGQKSINNIVDAVNFVMFDLGQPIHAFDLDKLESESLIIRNGKAGEKLTTLDKKEINLDDSILVIADEKSPLAIAGIKGGMKAEVDLNTKNIIIEVANFDATTTRKTAKKINIQTDAVKRYEHGITPELCPIVMDSISEIIYAIAGGEVESIIDIYPNKVLQNTISISVEYINKRLGSDFSKEEIESVWKKLNFVYRELDGEYKIEVPFLRADLIGPHDLTEEVIRILGYDRLVEKLPEFTKDSQITDNTYLKLLLVRNNLLSLGYGEVMTYVFRDKGEVEVLASATGKNFLRTNLTDGLKESIKLNILNLPLLDLKEVKVFEIGTVFFNGGEVMHVAYGDKKNVTEMNIDDFCEKFNLLAEDNLNIENQAKNDREKKIFKMWSSYPFIVRDIAVWVNNENGENILENKEKLIKIYKELGGEILDKEPILFDEFTKDGKTSIAYRLIFQSYTRTLTDEEVNDVMIKINIKIQELGFQVR